METNKPRFKWVAIAGVVLLLGGGLLIMRAWAAAQQQISINKMTHIGLALHHYHDRFDCFPPAYLEGDDGKPLVSWRVMIAPFMADNMRGAYANEIDWTDPKSESIIRKYEGRFDSPHGSEPGMTPYIAVVGPDTMITNNGRVGFYSVVDGTPNTILLIEDVNHPVPWDAPQDATMEEFLARYDAEEFPAQGFLATFGDASVRLIPLGHREDVQHLMGCSDGQIVPRFPQQ